MRIDSFDINDELLVNEFVSLSEDEYFDNDHLSKNKLDLEKLKHELSNHNEFFTHARAKFFLLKDASGKNIGRILAFIDHLVSNEIGLFGYFICPNQDFMGKALFKSAEEWLQNQGVKTIKGPINLNIYNSYRIMTEGFDTDIYLGEPRNPSYYKDLFVNNDYKVDAQWRSFDLNKKQCYILEQGINQAVLAAPKSEIIIHTVDLNNLEAELRILYPHALEIFSENYNFSHIGENEFVSQFMNLKNVLAPGSFLIAKDKDECVGFVYGYLDFAANLKNNEFQTMPKRFVFHTFGVKQSHRKSVVAYLLAQSILEKIGPYFEDAIGALAKEGKSFYDKIAQPSRVYCTFKKALS